jgi:hypothetical protein
MREVRITETRGPVNSNIANMLNLGRVSRAPYGVTMQGISADLDPVLVMQEAMEAGIEDNERELRKWCLIFAFQCSGDGVYGDEVIRLATTLERYVVDGHTPEGATIKAV